MTKEEAIRWIERLAKTNGGKVSWRLFLRETGTPEQRIRRELWFSGWNDLLREAGLETNEFSTSRVPDEGVIKAFAGLAKKLDRWPTQDDCIREKKRDKAFPGVEVVGRLRRSGKLREALENYASSDEGYKRVRELAALQPRDKSAEETASDTARVQGFVYMLRNGRRYKVGHTNSPVRRFREVRLELPEETLQVHTIETDDPRGIEEYWHRRFAKRRIRDTEWFELAADDIRAFKRRKYQ